MIDLIVEPQEETTLTVANIVVIGVGGGGNNTINALVDAGLTNMTFIAVNTDAQSLQLSRAHHRINIGVKTTKGLGTGDNPELGRQAAEENLTDILACVKGADVVFLVGGMGGGTGSGALPVIAHALCQEDLLTIGLVTKPFSFEGKRRARVAAQAIEQLSNVIDTLLVIPNEKLLETAESTVSMLDGFGMVNKLLAQLICSITDIITKPGHINVDFADVRTIMKHRGPAVMGTGRARGENRARIAAQQAISCPLLEQVSLTGVKGVLLHIIGDANLRLDEIGKAASVIYQEADEDAHIIIGSTIDHTMQDEIMVTIVATGLNHAKQQKPHIIPAVSATSANTKTALNSNDHIVQYASIITETVPTPSSLSPQSIAAEHNINTTIDTHVNVEQHLPHPDEQLRTPAQEPATSIIDLNDLDVPTFLRQEYKKKSDAA